MKTAPYNCGAIPTETAKNEAQNYKIEDVAILFTSKGMIKDDPYYVVQEKAVDMIKKAITEVSPVSISMSIPKSFSYLKKPVWTPPTPTNQL